MCSLIFPLGTEAPDHYRSQFPFAWRGESIETPGSEINSLDFNKLPVFIKPGDWFVLQIKQFFPYNRLSKTWIFKKTRGFSTKDTGFSVWTTKYNCSVSQGVGPQDSAVVLPHLHGGGECPQRLHRHRRLLPIVWNYGNILMQTRNNALC